MGLYRGFDSYHHVRSNQCVPENTLLISHRAADPGRHLLRFSEQSFSMPFILVVQMQVGYRDIYPVIEPYEACRRELSSTRIFVSHDVA